MKDKIEKYFNKYNVKIVENNFCQIDDVKLDRQFQYVRNTIVPFTLDDFIKQMDKVFPRENAKYVSFDYNKIISPTAQGERHFIRISFDDGRDEITKRNDNYYEKAHYLINALLYDDYGNKKRKILKKDMMIVLNELRGD